MIDGFQPTNKMKVWIQPNW